MIKQLNFPTEEESNFLGQHLCKLTSLVELFNISSTADEAAIKEDSWNACSTSHVTENGLDVLTIGTIFQLDSEKIKVQLFELLQ